VGLFRKKVNAKPWDRELLKPVLHCSICTGEQVAGFKNKATGKFEDVMFIRRPEDLETFKAVYGISEGEIEKEW